MKPNKQQQKMLAKLEEIGELKDVSVQGDVILRLAGIRLRIEKSGRVRYFDSELSDTNPCGYVGLIRLRGTRGRRFRIDGSNRGHAVVAASRSAGQ